MLPFSSEPDLNLFELETACTHTHTCNYDTGLPIISDVLSIPPSGVIHHNVQSLVSKLVDVEQRVGDCVNTTS